MKKSILMTVMVILIIWAGVFAQPNQPEETVSVPKSMLTNVQLQDLQTQELQQKIATYGKWVGMGDEIGKAVDGSLKAITSNAVELSETKLGKFTMFLVAWKVIGTDAIQLVVGLLLAMAFLPIFIWSYQRTCIPRRVLVEDSPDIKTRKWKIINGNDDDDTKVLRIVHLVIFIAWIIISAIVIFA